MKKILAIIFLLGVINCYSNTPKYDLCVYGESASGVIAAIQAARMGKKVVLLSKNNHVGGLVTSGLTATDMNRNDLVGGVTKEFYNRIYNYYLNKDAWFNQDRDSFMKSTLKRTYRGKNDERQIQWVYESSVAENIMKEMLKESGVEVLYNHRLDLLKKVEKKDNVIECIYLDNGKSISSKMFIDSSYEGDLLARAGISYIVGRESNLQYGETYNGIRVNYNQGTDLTQISPYIKEGDPNSGLLPYISKEEWGEQGDSDERVQAYCYRMTLTNDPKNMIKIVKPKNYNPLWYEIHARMLKIQPELTLEKIITLTPMPNKKTDTNHLDFFGASYDYAEADYVTRDKIEKLHKDYALGLLWFLGNDKRVPKHIRKQMLEWGLPKDEFKDTENFPYQIYVRESRRMVGEFVMTEKNIRKENRVFADHSVGLGSYPLDCHFVSRVVTKDGKLRNEGTMFLPILPYTISYYSLTPKKEECSNLLATVCLSSSHVAYSTIRMEPVYMILGQSAATAASIAIDCNSAVQDISYEVLKYNLIKDGQLLYPPLNKK